MSSSSPLPQPRTSGRLAAGLLGLLALAAATTLAWTLLGGAASPPMAVATRPAPAAPHFPAPAPSQSEPAVAPPAARPALPAFDIVRVAPDGQTVLAGRGRPGGQVAIADNGHVIAQAQADAQGQWAAVPAAPLAPGPHQLTLPAAVDATESTAVRGAPPTAAPVIVLLPTPGSAAPSGPLALLTPTRGMPRLLQAPEAAPTAASVPGSAARLGLGIVDYDGHGEIRFAGTAPPGSTIRLYVDRRSTGDTRADAQGHWMLQPGASVSTGRHQLRLDQLAASGAVAARVALPFDRVVLPDGAVLDGNIVVQPGQNLWRIARHAYGLGIRYTVIYLANRSQIRNPALIYPGQVFAVPASAGTSSANPNPALSSTAR